jgi:hypothetical protein
MSSLQRMFDGDVPIHFGSRIIFSTDNVPSFWANTPVQMGNKKRVIIFFILGQFLMTGSLG